MRGSAYLIELLLCDMSVVKLYNYLIPLTIGQNIFWYNCNFSYSVTLNYPSFTGVIKLPALCRLHITLNIKFTLFPSRPTQNTWDGALASAKDEWDKVIQMNQLLVDATMIYWSIRSTQHVSGNILPIIRSVWLCTHSATLPLNVYLPTTTTGYHML